MTLHFLRFYILLLIGFISIHSYGQTSKGINPVLVDRNIKSVEIAPQENYDTLTYNRTSSDWYSENAVDGTVTITMKKNQPQVVHNKQYFEGEIIRINQHITAINAKIEIVNSDPELQLKAQEEGWFDDMERIKNELEIEKLSAQTILNNI